MVQQYVEQIRDKGYCVVKGGVNTERVGEINQQVQTYFDNHYPGIIYEKNSDKVRGIHGPHLYEPFFRELTRDSLCLAVSKQLLSSDVYIHQFKINTKPALVGESWPWHQDYIFWENRDYLPQPRLINVAILLGETSMLHGPLCLIPNSHKKGNLSKAVHNLANEWDKDVSVNLTYQVHRAELESLMAENQVKFITGEAGDILFFDPLLVHCSSNNLSLEDRHLLIMTYNSVDNLPNQQSIRPEFISSRDFTAIT